MPDKYRQYLPWGISIGAHLIVVIIMMIWMLPIMKAQTWYEVSWSDEFFDEEVTTVTVSRPSTEVTIAAGGAPEHVPSSKPKQSPKTSSLPKGPDNPPVAPTKGESHPGKDELVEAPVFALQQPALQIPSSLRSNPRAVDALRETVSGAKGTASAGSVNADIEGGKLVRTDTKVRTHTLGDFAEVKLSFRVDETAKLIESSIRVVQSNNSRFDAEAIKILKDMTFGFRGRPDTQNPYLITIRFSP
ncbi:MAG: hypothetical protein ACOYIS_01295 [Candidatus Cloacimonadaceae bacterium]|jgi:hypothetical protein